MIYLGKLLTKDDLNIFFYADDTGEEKLIDPNYVAYAIIDDTHGKQEVIRQTLNSVPMRFDTGSYFIPIKIDPQLFRVGRHYVQWSYKRFCDSQVMTKKQSFDITRTAAYAGEFCRSTYVTTYGDICSRMPLTQS